MDRKGVLWRVLLVAAVLAILLPSFRREIAKHEIARWPRPGCEVFRDWLTSRRWRAEALVAALPAPADPAAGAMLQEAMGDVLQWVGWPAGLKFAAFRRHSLKQVLASPSLQATGALLVVLPGKTPLRKRAPDEPFLRAAPGCSNLTAVLPLRAINAAAAAIEALRGGRRLHAFTLSTAHLPLCAGASGACALWEGGSGRIVLHEGLVRRMAATQGLPELLASFARSFVSRLAEGGAHDTAAMAAAAGAAPQAANNASAWSDAGRSGRAIAKTKELTAPGGGRNAAGAGELGVRFSVAAAGAAVVVLASQLPLWWCLACPTVLGLLSPFVFNFGLTAAAEELCAVLELPPDECSDLWWGAFALAMIVSLASALPIVYLCRLPDCVKRPRASMATSI